MAGRLNSTRNALQIAERRTQTRTLVTTPLYVDLDNVNGGLIFNLTEDGLALTTARSLPSDNHLNVRIQTPDSKGWIEASGEIVWRSKSNKEAGVRFVSLEEKGRHQISDLIIAETLGGEYHSKEATSTGTARQTLAANDRIKNWMATEARGEKVHSEGATSAPLPGLSEDAHQRLRSWIFQGEANKDSGVVKHKVPAKTERPAGVASEGSPSTSISEAQNSGLAVNKEKKDATLRAKADVRLDENESVVVKPTPPPVQAAPNTLQDKRDALGTAERRARTRTLLTLPIYVDLEKVSGGLVSEMSEDGIALTAANIPAGDGPLTLRIQLPDDGDWIEVTGQIVWKSKSGKTAGVKFSGLPEGTRQRIRNWLTKESSQSEPQPTCAALPKREQATPNEAQAGASETSPPEPASPNTAVEKSIPERDLSEASFVLSSKPAEIMAELGPHEVPASLDQHIDKKSLPQTRERRTHPRSRIRPVSYIELGADNGGMLLNLGEGGLAVNAAMPLSRVDLPAMRIQLTGSQDWIEVSGQLAWIAESRKEAGIRFIRLTEEARQKIASRICREELQQEIPAKSVRMLEGRTTHAEKPGTAGLEIPVPVAGAAGRVVQEHSQGPVGARPLAPIMRAARAPTTTVGPSVLRANSPKKIGSKTKPGLLFHPVSSETRSKRLWGFAAMFVPAALTTVAIGWVVAAPAVRNGVIAFLAKSTATSKPAEVQESLSGHKSPDISVFGPENNEKKSHGIESIPSGRAANGLESHPLQPQVRTIERPASKPTASGPAHQAESSAPKRLAPKTAGHTVASVPNPTVETARSQTMESSRPQAKVNAVIATPSTSASAPSGTTVPEVKEKESPPAPSRAPVAPAGPTWSVAVSTDPYPSIRIPANVSSQRAATGKNLQIGRAISRVEPVYPEEAKWQGMEGTVRLHVVVSRDGAVQSVEVTSGPALLAKAAESAVRQWRYAQTSLGGQPVETEQDIVVKFELVSASNSKN